MLFHSSLRKELARTFGATLIVLVTVVMTMTLVRTLGMASRGNFNPADVMLVMSYTVMGFLPNIMAMGLFLAVVATLARLYRDSEMVIWFNSGIGLTGLLRPMLRFAWPILLAIAGLSLFVLPWANLQIEEMRTRYESRGDLERVEPGQFQESSGGSRVFFIEKNLIDQQVASNVFISTQEGPKETVTSARSGQIEVIGEDRFLVLGNGQRLESHAIKKSMSVLEFSQYGIRVGSSPASVVNELPLSTRPSLELLRRPSPQHWGELSWRLGFVLAAGVLLVVALATTDVNPRVGRTGNLIFSMFTFQVYLNMLNLGQVWIAAGKIDFAPMMLLLHGGTLGVASIWLMKRHHQWRWLPNFSTRPRQQPQGAS